MTRYIPPGYDREKMIELQKVFFDDKEKFLNKYIGIEDRKIFMRSGVYMIGDFYIGQSAKIYFRIRQHVHNAITDRHCNSKVQSRLINSFFKGEKVGVKLLHKDVEWEDFYIGHYHKSGYPLLNQLKNIHKK